MKTLLIFWLGLASFGSANAQDKINTPGLNPVWETAKTVGIPPTLSAVRDRARQMYSNDTQSSESAVETAFTMTQGRAWSGILARPILQHQLTPVQSIDEQIF